MRQFVTAAVILVVVAIAGGLLIIAVAQVRGAANRARCQNNLKQIALAVHNYASSYRDALPLAAIANDNLPSDRRLSWLVTLMPYIQSDTLYRDTAKGASWDDPANDCLLPIEYKSYHCPSAFASRDGQGRYLTQYVGMAGLDMNVPEDGGLFSFEYTTRLPDIPDLGATLLVVETRVDNGPWPAAGWPTLRTLDRAGAPYLGRGGQFEGHHSGIGTIAAFADGSVTALDANLDPRTFEAMATPFKRKNTPPAPE